VRALDEELLLILIEKAIYEDNLLSEQIIRDLGISEALFLKLWRKLRKEKHSSLIEINKELENFYRNKNNELSKEKKRKAIGKNEREEALINLYNNEHEKTTFYENLIDECKDKLDNILSAQKPLFHEKQPKRKKKNNIIEKQVGLQNTTEKKSFVEYAKILNIDCPQTKKQRTILMQRFIDEGAMSKFELVIFDGVYQTKNEFIKAYNEERNKVLNGDMSSILDFDYVCFYAQSFIGFVEACLQMIDSQVNQSLESTARNEE